MVWFKVDDNLAFHHKTVAAGNAAMGLWVRAGSLAAEQLTDGFVADHMAAIMGTPAQIKRLVGVGLWIRVEGGYRFHDWGERNPSRAAVEAERLAAAERMRAARDRKKQEKVQASSQVSELSSPEQDQNERRTSPEVRTLFGDPDPTRPDPTPKEIGPRKRARQIPDDWQPSDAHAELARSLRLNPGAELAKFRDHFKSNGKPLKDWDAAFRNWLRRSAEMGTPPTVAPAKQRTHARDIELAPDNLSPAEYAAWEADQRAKRAQS